MRITFWTQHRDSYYRCQLPAEELRGAGYETEVTNTLSPRHVNGGLVVLHRGVTVFETMMLWMMQSQGLPVIYDYDIDVLSATTGPYADPDLQDRVRKNLERATAVSVPTQHLRDVAYRYNSNVIFSKNYVSRESLTDPAPSNKLTIGWAGYETENLNIVRSCINRMERDHGIRWHTIGEKSRLGLKRHDHTDAQSHDEFKKALDFDIAVEPLQETDFNEYLTAIKAIEYGAAGIPVVASKYGPYATYISHGYNGYLAAGSRDWVRYVERLVEQPELRQKLGKQARDMASKRTMANFDPIPFIRYVVFEDPTRYVVIMEMIRRARNG